MGLSYSTVQEAYKVLHNVKQEALPELGIPSWPEDMAKWDWQKKREPPTNIVLGYDKKAAHGWENLLFFVDRPTEELKAAFKKHNTIVFNSSICRQNEYGSSVWIFGWF